MKVDATKIREIARRLGVSERTVEEYLLDRLILQESEGLPLEGAAGRQGPGVVDRSGEPIE